MYANGNSFSSGGSYNNGNSMSLGFCEDGRWNTLPPLLFPLPMRRAAR